MGSLVVAVGSSLLTRDQTQAPGTGIAESEPLDHQGSPRLFHLTFTKPFAVKLSLFPFYGWGN